LWSLGHDTMHQSRWNLIWKSTALVYSLMLLLLLIDVGLWVWEPENLTFEMCCYPACFAVTWQCLWFLVSAFCVDLLLGTVWITSFPFHSYLFYLMIMNTFTFDRWLMPKELNVEPVIVWMYRYDWCTWDNCRSVSQWSFGWQVASRLTPTGVYQLLDCILCRADDTTQCSKRHDS